MLRVLAPAKLNLFLHILGRRADGYHELESLVVFTGLHDVLEVTSAPALELIVQGPFAASCGGQENNLVMKAARLLQETVPSCRVKGARFTLTKNIPAGAGLGGGSSDAATALRLLDALWDLQLSPPTLQSLAVRLGADVAMFLHAPQPLMASGIGEVIAPLSAALPRLWAVLVHPNKPLLTERVYQTYHHAPHTALKPALESDEALLASLIAARNDLQPAAIALLPEVAEILLAFETGASKPLLARMTGSGACCFALFAQAEQAQRCAARMRAEYPHWWVELTKIAP